MIREIILDTETTGLSPNDGHRIVEIGALEMIDKVLTGEKFHFYINPQRDMPLEAYKIHGISNQFLQDKPLFKDIADKFLDFIKDSTLVIHNAPFDVRFLNHELSLLNLPSLELSVVIDTLIIARRAFPGAKVNLDALCKRFKVDNSSRQYHGALKDAELLSEVYIELTGGRQTSFVIKNKIVENNISQFDNVSLKGNKIVIIPSSEELKLHEKLMNKII
ncbi:MAG: DNA polymerase III subunit epsilon [Rickettsiales bacterium]|nr:MAG: DNA polymerase III subunit epsilon [Rickettsiales bacterium]